MRSFVIAVSFLALACGNGGRPGSTTGNQAASKPTLRLAIVTDLQGQLEPCGCQSRPLGGVDRLATAIQRLRVDGTPTLLLLAGDLLFGAEAAHGHPTGSQAVQQDTWRAETVVEIVNRLGPVALVPGAADAAGGATASDGLISRVSGKSLATVPNGPRGVILSHIQDLGGTEIAIVGIDGTVGDDQGAISTAVTRLREAGAAVVIALVSGERRAANQVARTAGVDFVVSGGIDSKTPTAPTSVGRAHVLTAGRQGEGVLNVEIHRTGDGPFVDLSPWSRDRTRQALARSIDELTSRIAAWERQPTIDRVALDEQKARLAALERERGATAVTDVAGNHFVASWIEVGTEVPRDSAIEALIGAYSRRVNEHNRVALADVKAPPAAAGQPHYVGSAQCESCHQKAFAWWTDHPHGRAYATLQEVNKEFNLSCVGCHVTGYNRPGGSTVVQNAGLTNVGCESCHGPGSQHVDDPDAEPYSVQRVVPESVCVTCHNPDHSDKFEYVAYREKLLVIGHGRSVVTPPVTPPVTP